MRWIRKCQYGVSTTESKCNEFPHNILLNVWVCVPWRPDFQCQYNYPKYHVEIIAWLWWERIKCQCTDPFLLYACRSKQTHLKTKRNAKKERKDNFGSLVTRWIQNKPARISLFPSDKAISHQTSYLEMSSKSCGTKLQNPKIGPTTMIIRQIVTRISAFSSLSSFQWTPIANGRSIVKH